MLRLFCAFLIMLSLCIFPARAVPHLTIDLDNGRVLSQQEAFDPWHPASLTKLMTAFVIFRAIENREVSPSDAVRVSKNATRQPTSKMGYGAGTTLTIENALKLLIVKSANDIAVALAETVSGSVPAFADRMNREAAQLGMTGSRFANPHGLHDPRQMITARDFGLLLQTLHNGYPKYAAFFKAPAVLAQKRNKNRKIIERVYYSYNLLLERYRGADGFKTGFVCASGYNFAGSATRAGRRIAAIVLGRDSQTSRAVDAAKLITEGFELPISAGTPIRMLKPDANLRLSPRNMRPILCTEQARAKRYEPGAGVAIINSPWLQARVKQPVTLRATLGTDAPSFKVPVPKPRPSFKPPAPIDGLIKAARSSFALPTFRPGTVVN